MSDKLVPVGSYDNRMEAEMARIRLEDEGILAFLADDSFGSLYPGNEVMGTIRLLVKEEDRGSAEELLACLATELEDEGDGEATATEEEPESPTAVGDALATHAWRAAVLGWMICGLGYIYSVWLITRLAFHNGELSAAGKRRYYGAVLINLLVFGGFGFLIWWSRLVED